VESERSQPPSRDLGARIAVAAPAVCVGLLCIFAGGAVFAALVALLGLVAIYELSTLMKASRPSKAAGFVGVVGLVLAALYGSVFQVLLVLVATLPLTFGFVVFRQQRQDASQAIAATLFGIVWLALPLAYAILLRDAGHGRDLLIDVLFATFVGDSGAYFVGKALGRHRLAPSISPNKTIEGLIAGLITATAAFVGLDLAYQQAWLAPLHALLIGACVALAAPVGDLFESFIKRDFGVKDTGAFFGAHGGVVDRLDAVLFTVVTAYYVSLAVM
jgi:phosphatidate cytidylyltransferase